MEWLCLDKEENMLFELVDSGWLQRTSDLEYMMHPIISFTVKNEITPKIQDCINLVTALSKSILLEAGNNYLRVSSLSPSFFLSDSTAQSAHFLHSSSQSRLSKHISDIILYARFSITPFSFLLLIYSKALHTSFPQS